MPTLLTSWTTSLWPWAAARWRGVSSPMLVVCTRAPRPTWTNNLIQSCKKCKHCQGILNFRGPQYMRLTVLTRIKKIKKILKTDQIIVVNAKKRSQTRHWAARVYFKFFLSISEFFVVCNVKQIISDIFYSNFKLPRTCEFLCHRGTLASVRRNMKSVKTFRAKFQS